MGKKIAVFSTAWNGEHIGGILNGMQQKINETNNDMYIFNTYGGFEEEKEFNDCEYNIFNLALQSDFDGVLILSNNIASYSRLGTLMKQIKDRKIPCISIEQDVPDFHFIGTNNYTAMSEVVEHLITVHGCRIMNFVGGFHDHIENMERRKAFVDVLVRHGIPVEQDRIRDYCFSRESGEQAFWDFYEMGMELPDAVVCANDDMAIGYIKMAEQFGYSVPDDVLVTGFDNLSQAYCNIPSISSVGRSRESLGRQAVEQLLGMMEGRKYPHAVYVKSRFSPNLSCGCGKGIWDFKKVQKEKSDMEYNNMGIRWSINIMQKRLLACQDEKEFCTALEKERKRFSFSRLCLMINQEEYDLNPLPENTIEETDQKGYPSRMRLLFQEDMDAGSAPVMIQTSKLVPENYLEDGKNAHVFVFLPLHLQGRNFGYCILQDCLKYIYDGNLFYWVSELNAAIEHIKQNSCIRKLNRKLEHMYMHDSLTDLYNRFAIRDLGEPLLKKNIAENRQTLFLFGDLDGLKSLNDIYGHEVGDRAIQAAAWILMQSCPDRNYLCIRYGGDEFLMLGTYREDRNADWIKKKIEDRVCAYNEKKELPVPLSMSIGTIITSSADEASDINYYISRADTLMYQIKRKRR
ncbi:MAG: GGDEF domain-containing protein [Lachnospiraceae bacterium]|nr:GGDEF domain-containing protein [Lachnospiraceae bacterium]